MEAAVKHPCRTKEVKYVKADRVIDGGTIVLMDRSRVRLEGIDSPERDQPYGPTAMAALEYMVRRSVFYVETDYLRSSLSSKKSKRLSISSSGTLMPSGTSR